MFVLVFCSYFGRKWKKRAKKSENGGTWPICEENQNNSVDWIARSDRPNLPEA